MKLGMIVRADMGRGLAHQTHTFHRHLRPEVTVAVDMSGITRKPWAHDFDAYPGAVITKWGGYLTSFENPAALEALAECDVAYSAETYYDERLPSMVKTILHVNPEFYRGEPASMFWHPTRWRFDEMPQGPLVPTPIEDERVADSPPGPGKILHTVGHMAARDRNGTRTVKVILQQVREPWRITSQDSLSIGLRLPWVETMMGHQLDRWALYDGCSILVLPRRYGGQSLPVNEAMARGLAVIMTDCSPNPVSWPVIPVRSRRGPAIKTPGGVLNTFDASPGALTEAIRSLLRDPEELQRRQALSLAWAGEQRWSVQEPAIRSLVEAAAS